MSKAACARHGAEEKPRKTRIERANANVRSFRVAGIDSPLIKIVALAFSVSRCRVMV
jgi:hypothetical protein